MGLERSRINFRDLWNKTKYYQGAEDFFFRDLGKSMHYFKGAREHRPPGEGLNIRSYNHEKIPNESKLTYAKDIFSVASFCLLFLYGSH